ncbi:hypothetical protein MXD59_08120 [Frankia sp. Ag45/Mut15]|uniref:Uncharacterized protein n=1 Tax=Frankia umida TaxID=573489 RepID=A0ABT0JW37_9ACTN|nr:hypothetical protein [Frankia umida]MCK9875738.1 hypothetical protein [Frankia umida]
MTGLPRIAVLGLDAATAAAAVALVDGGLEIAVFAPEPISPDDVAALAAYGCADRLVALVPATLRLSAATPTAPPFEIHGTPADHEPSAPAEVTRPDAGAPLGTFDAVVLNDHTGHLLPTAPAGPAAPSGASSQPGVVQRFGDVFDPRAAWVFHIGGPVELGAARGRWIGEYLRGRYALPANLPAGPDADPGHGHGLGAGSGVGAGARSGVGARPGAGGLPGMAATAMRGRPWRRGARSTLADLDRELQAGHARAATAGYPLPTPSAWLTPSQ